MRSPLSSRTNSRPKRVTPDEFFDLVASSVVMVLPSVSQLPSLNLPSLALFEPHVPPSPVSPANRAKLLLTRRGNHARRIRQDEPTSGISQAIGNDFGGPGSGRADCAREACLAGLDSGPGCRSLTDGATFAERRVLGRWLSGLVGGRRTRLSPWLATGRRGQAARRAARCSCRRSPVPLIPRSPHARIRTKGRTGQGVGAAPSGPRARHRSDGAGARR